VVQEVGLDHSGQAYDVNADGSRSRVGCTPFGVRDHSVITALPGRGAVTPAAAR
jgi:hypothetical protein